MPNNIKHSSKNGFTLIELLLVIAIMSIIVTLLINTYTKNATADKVSKMATEIQEINQAASAYYVNNLSWPDNFNAFLSYLPFTSSNTPPLNPWGYPYVIKNSNGLKFFVQSQVPTATLAQQVADILPFGQIQGTAISVSTTPPAQIPNLPNIKIKEIGITPQISSVEAQVPLSFRCPVNWTAKVLVNILGIYSVDYDNIKAGSNAIDTLDAGETTPDSYCNKTSTTGDQAWYLCTINNFSLSTRTNTSRSLEDGYIKAKFMYIAYCVNNQGAY